MVEPSTYASYLIGVFALIKIIISELEDVVIRFKRLKEKIQEVK